MDSLALLLLLALGAVAFLLKASKEQEHRLIEQITALKKQQQQQEQQQQQQQLKQQTSVAEDDVKSHAAPPPGGAAVGASSLSSSAALDALHRQLDLAARAAESAASDATREADELRTRLRQAEHGREEARDELADLREQLAHEQERKGRMLDEMRKEMEALRQALEGEVAKQEQQQQPQQPPPRAADPPESQSQLEAALLELETRSQSEIDGLREQLVRAEMQREELRAQLQPLLDGTDEAQIAISKKMRAMEGAFEERCARNEQQLEELRACKQQLEAMRNRVEEAEQKMLAARKLQEQLKEAQAELIQQVEQAQSSAASSAAAAAASLAAVQAELEQAQAAARAAQSELKEAQAAAKSHVCAPSAAAINESEELGASLMAEKQRAAELEHQLTEARAAVVAAQQQQRDGATVAASAQQQFDADVAEALSATNASLAEAREAQDKLASELKDEKQAHKDAEESLAAERAAVESLRAELSAAAAAAAAAAASSQENDDKLTTAQKREEEMRTELAQVQKDLVAAQEATAAATAAAAAGSVSHAEHTREVSEKAAALAAAQESLTATVAETQAQLQASRGREADATKATEEAQAILAATTKEQESLLSQLKAAEEALASAHAESTSLRDEIERLRQSVKAAEEAAAAATAATAAHTASSSERAREVSEQAAELAAAHAAIVAAHDTQAAHVATLSQQVESLRVEAQTHMAAAQDIQARLEKKEQQVQELQKRIDSHVCQAEPAAPLQEAVAAAPVAQPVVAAIATPAPAAAAASSAAPKHAPKDVPEQPKRALASAAPVGKAPADYTFAKGSGVPRATVLELHAYATCVQEQLGSDRDLQHLLPFEALLPPSELRLEDTERIVVGTDEDAPKGLGLDLPCRLRDGLILAKLINVVAPGTIDERVLNRPSIAASTLPHRSVVENLNVVIASAKSIGVAVKSAQDVSGTVVDGVESGSAQQSILLCSSEVAHLEVVLDLLFSLLRQRVLHNAFGPEKRKMTRLATMLSMPKISAETKKSMQARTPSLQQQAGAAGSSSSSSSCNPKSPTAVLDGVLANFDQTSELNALTPEQLLLRWVNWCILTQVSSAASDSPLAAQAHLVASFAQDMDVASLALVIAQVDAWRAAHGAVPPNAPLFDAGTATAATALTYLQSSLHVPHFHSAASIDTKHGRLSLLLLALLFQSYPLMHAVLEKAPVTSMRVPTVQLRDASQRAASASVSSSQAPGPSPSPPPAGLLDVPGGHSRQRGVSQAALSAPEAALDEETESAMLKSYLNSCGIAQVQINHLLTDVRTGLVLLRMLDWLEPGSVDWRRAELVPSNPFKCASNLNLFLLLCREKFKLPMVNIGANDIAAENNGKYVLAIVWQLLRYNTLKKLREIRSQLPKRSSAGADTDDDSSKEITDQSILEWANAKVKARSHPLAAAHNATAAASWQDASLRNSLFLLNLLDNVQQGCVDWSAVEEPSQPASAAADSNSGELQALLLRNASYAISVSRKLGAELFALPADIVHANRKQLVLILASLMACEASIEAEQAAKSPE